jgi:hypothetical protein
LVICAQSACQRSSRRVNATASRTVVDQVGNAIVDIGDRSTATCQLDHRRADVHGQTCS